jgi:small subunit ribosomal protein S9
MYIGIGKRKTSVAKVCLKKGNGQIMINKILLDNTYISTNKVLNILNCIIFRIYKINKITNLYDAYIEVKGGGVNSQIDAITLALSKAICKIDIKYKILLKRKSLLTCDSRIKERRKYGLKKARKAPQFTKR